MARSEDGRRLGVGSHIAMSVCILAVLVVGGQCEIRRRIPLNSAGDIQKSSNHIALLHMVNDMWFFQELSSVTLSNKRRYAMKHQYEMVVHTPGETAGLLVPRDCRQPERDRWMQERPPNDCFTEKNTFTLDERAPTFGKIKLALDACVGRPNYWLLWSDADALIVNQSIPLHTIVDDAYDIMLAKDWYMINAGVLLFRCSTWLIDFLNRVYANREFDEAIALDQSALQHYLNQEPDADRHVKFLPKHVINAYTEEYRPGDFLVHMAGKLYEATIPGATAIARQLNVLSMQDDPKSVRAFFDTNCLLNMYSGHCIVREGDQDRHCPGDDPRRSKLEKPLGEFSYPDRYMHTALRNQAIAGFKDAYDVPGWDEKIKPRKPSLGTP